MKTILFIILSFVLLNIAKAQTLDYTFNQNYNEPYQKMIGKFLTVGSDGKLYTVYDKKFTTWNSDGGIDFNSTMNSDETPIQNSPYENQKIYRGSDGKFLYVQTIISNNEPLNEFLIMYNSDGSIDNAFICPSLTVVPSSYDRMIRSVIFQNDGKILLVGKFNYVNGEARNNIVRLNSNGSVDLTFNPGSGVLGEIWGVDITFDGKYVIGGEFGAYDGNPAKRVARINANGTFDNTFYTHTITHGFTDVIKQVKVMPGGQVLVTGTDYLINPIYHSRNIVKLLSNGQRDTSFTFNYPVIDISSVLVLPNGKILVDTGTRIIRINSNGSLDNTFNSPGSYYSNFPLYYDSMFLLPDGKVIVRRPFLGLNGAIRYDAFKINTNGSIDYSFNPLQSVSKDVAVFKVLSDNKILIFSTGTMYNDVICNKLIRLNSDGSFDSSFNIPENLVLDEYDYGDREYNFVQQNDGKIILYKTDSGLIKIGESVYKKIIRLNNDGTLDETFNNTYVQGSNLNVNDIVVTDDDKILILGTGSIFNQGSYRKLIRLNYDGSHDNTYVSPLYSDYNYFTRTADGNLFVNVYDNSSDQVFKKMNNQGQVDSSFDFSIYNTSLKIIEYQSDSNYLIASGGVIRRVNSNGVLDSSFNLIYLPENFGLLQNGIVVNSSGYIYLFNYLDDILIYDSNGNYIQTVSGLSNQKNQVMCKQGCDQIITYGNIYPEGVNGYMLSYGNILRVNLDFGLTPSPIGENTQFFEAEDTLDNLSVVGENIQWYSNQYLCEILPPPNFEDIPLPSSTLLEDGMTYYASQTLSGLESFLRLPVTVYSTLGLDNSLSDKLVLFPNPSSGELFYSNSEISNIEIYSLEGINLTHYVSINYSNHSININNLVEGIYIFKVLDGDNFKHYKIVKK